MLAIFPPSVGGANEAVTYIAYAYYNSFLSMQYISRILIIVIIYM